MQWMKDHSGVVVFVAALALAAAISGCQVGSEAPAISRDDSPTSRTLEPKARNQPSIMPESVLDWCIELGAAEYGGRTVYGEEGAATFKRADRVTNECKARWRARECATALECEVFKEGGGEFTETYAP